MKFPDDLKYSKEHEWVRSEDGTAVIGITDFAQDELGDIVFVEMPEVGTTLNASDSFGVAESVKTVSDLFSPISGQVIEVNISLENEPESVNNSPYDKGWMIKIKMSDPQEINSLLSVDEYKAFILESK
ncbi:MAG TPA: glycine cleavage system protein GcvH [Nitrospinota bacterium]|jgi:glycine cleavage system H protein|nr:glycine cleavage system protein GcvH [Nitrospinota bacterium]|tara:strand:+ start:15637 stop:16023 length:387 start_codon:yes stop_codon:yes gene_type:complete